MKYVRKRILALLLALAFVLGMAGCGSQSAEDTTVAEMAEEESTASEETADAVDPDAEIVLAGYRNLALVRRMGTTAAKFFMCGSRL